MSNLFTKNLSVFYQNKQGLKKTILDQINVNLEPDKITVLLGVNGIGKSSLLKVLAGLQTNFSGDIILNQKKIQTYSMAEKAKTISVVLTEKPHHSYLTVKEIVSLGRQSHTNWTGKLNLEDENIIANCLIMMKIENLSHHYLHTLSDGQLQKVLIARALAQTGNIMLLDEPTAHLDICNKAEIWYLLKKIAQKEHKSILLTSHDIEFSLQVADIIWLIYQQNLFVFSPENLIASKMLDNVFESQYFSFKGGDLVIHN